MTDWPEAVREYEEMWHGENRAEGREAASAVNYADAAIAALKEMVRRFYWQRNELLRLSTAYPAVMKEKLEADWEKRS